MTDRRNLPLGMSSQSAPLELHYCSFQVSSFLSVIWPMEVWHHLDWLTVKLSAREVQHYLWLSDKCPCNCCLMMVSLKSLLFKIIIIHHHFRHWNFYYLCHSVAVPLPLPERNGSRFRRKRPSLYACTQWRRPASASVALQSAGSHLHPCVWHSGLHHPRHL